MKNKKSVFGYSIIIAIAFIAFIMVISSTDADSKYMARHNGLKITDIFKIKKDLDDLDPHLTIELEDDGYDIYVPKARGYRYGPSIIYYEDGTMDAWFAANGTDGAWDYVTYRHFDGENWSEEEVVLKPTKGSKDHYSVCDPGVIYFNDYYYIGYTSTENAFNGGVENCGYVARSKNPNGPFEKWSGDHWGDNPEPIIVYDGDDRQWGAGEISFVVVDEKLYCYYSWISTDGNSMKLMTSDLSEDWPAKLIEKGTVLTKGGSEDSCDVVYNDEYERFVAFCMEYRFTDYASIAVYESDDGTSFTRVDSVGKHVEDNAHNMGISKKPNGHVSLGDKLMVGYAHSKGRINIWGVWSTMFQTINLKLTNNINN